MAFGVCEVSECKVLFTFSQLSAYPSTFPSQQVLVRVKHVESVDRLKTLRVLYEKHDIIFIIGQDIC